VPLVVAAAVAGFVLGSLLRRLAERMLRGMPASPTATWRAPRAPLVEVTTAALFAATAAVHHDQPAHGSGRRHGDRGRDPARSRR
jgi:hypothetical protein